MAGVAKPLIAIDQSIGNNRTVNLFYFISIGKFYQIPNASQADEGKIFFFVEFDLQKKYMFSVDLCQINVVIPAAL